MVQRQHVDVVFAPQPAPCAALCRSHNPIGAQAALCRLESRLKLEYEAGELAGLSSSRRVICTSQLLVPIKHPQAPAIIEATALSKHEKFVTSQSSQSRTTNSQLLHSSFLPRPLLLFPSLPRQFPIIPSHSRLSLPRLLAHPPPVLESSFASSASQLSRNSPVFTRSIVAHSNRSGRS